MEGRFTFRYRYLAGIRTVTRAASRMHFYGSVIWVNVPNGRYNTFSESSTIVGPNSSQGT